MRILAIDPGPEQSAYVITDDGRYIYGGMTANGDMHSVLAEEVERSYAAIEMVACYGMPVGAETFDTCRWIGRFEQDFITLGGPPPELIYRKDVKMHLCQSMRAKDGNIRQALIDKLGVVGTKKNPGPLFGVSGHLWAALAVADYAATHPTP